MIKKMMLLALAVGALVALAAPAAASASEWTYDGKPIPAEEIVQEEYEGFLSFTTPAPPLPVKSTFGCEVTVIIQAEGGGGANVTKFAPTTTECEGTGVFTNCHLIADESNPPWSVGVNAADLTVEGTVLIKNSYTSCASGITASELGFVNVTATTANGASGISTITIEGTAENTVTTASGSVHAETGGRLGIDY